jgi:hypothetical protein
MSDTPETDAMALSDSRTDHNWRQLCRKLERERDEAREKFDTEATEHMLAINKVCGERDEARELAQQMSESNQVLLADVRFYRNAWEQLKEAAE